MTYTRMSLGCAIFMALLSTLYVGITETAESNAEPAAYSLADVVPFYWTKRHLKWALVNDPVAIGKNVVIEAMEAACAMWGKWSTITCGKASPGQKPDIRVQAVPKSGNYAMYTHYDGPDEMDRTGVTLVYRDLEEWKRYGNGDWIPVFRARVLYHMGEMLGIGNSKVVGSVMCIDGANPSPRVLHKDDIDAIQKKYGSKGAPVTFGGRQQPPSSSSRSSNTSTTGGNPYPQGSVQWRRWGDAYLRRLG